MKCPTSGQMNNFFGQGLITDQIGVCHVAQAGFKFVVLLPYFQNAGKTTLGKVKSFKQILLL